MPIYEYRCESCGEELEKIQKFSDPPLKDCPVCGKSALKKLVSASSFRLKGSGWYETDFKNRKKPDDGSRTGGKEDAGQEGSEGSKEGSKESSKESGKDTGTEGGGNSSKDKAAPAKKTEPANPVKRD